MESLHQTVTLRAQEGGMGFMNAQAFTHGGKHPGLEISSLVTVQGLRHPKVTEHAPQQGIHHCLCLLVRERLRFRPFGKVVDGGQDVAVLLLLLPPLCHADDLQPPTDYLPLQSSGTDLFLFPQFFLSSLSLITVPAPV